MITSSANQPAPVSRPKSGRRPKAVRRPPSPVRRPPSPVRLPNLEDEFIILSDLGQGAYGKVYLVRWRQDNRTYALKVSPQPAVEGEYYLSDLLKSPTGQCHPHLVCYQHLGYYSDHGQKVEGLLMDVVPGISLTDRRKQGTFSEEEVWRVARHLLEALAVLEKNGLAHRDIKPDNIIFDGTNYVLIDLGFICQMRGDLYPCRGTAGTFRFMAPEIQNRSQDYRKSDVWSLGAVLYYLTNRDEPSGSPVAVTDPRLKALIESMLRTNPKSRKTATQLLKEI